MAQKDKSLISEDIKKVPSIDDKISRAVEASQDQFPEASSIEVEYRYRDAFEVPKYCNQKEYAFAWLDPRDDIGWHNGIENDHWCIVTRVSACFVDNGLVRAETDFRSHGAIERKGMILVYRPQDIEKRMRAIPINQHYDMFKSVSESKEQGSGVTTSGVRVGDDNTPMEVVAFEEAGTEGIVSVE